MRGMSRVLMTLIRVGGHSNKDTGLLFLFFLWPFDKWVGFYIIW